MQKLSQKSNDRVEFLYYALGKPEGGFDGWYAGLPPEVQAEIDVSLETLLNSKRPWPITRYEALHGAWYGLTEIKVAVPCQESTDEASPEDDDNDDCDHYRILAWEGPRRNCITLLVGFKKEKTSDYAQPGRSALRRRDGVKKDERRATRWNVP
jgi:hypothetical protein